MLNLLFWILALMGGGFAIYYLAKHVHALNSEARAKQLRAVEKVPVTKALDEFRLSMLYIDMSQYLKYDQEIDALESAVERNPNDYKSAYRLMYMKSSNERSLKTIVSQYTALVRN